MEGAVHGRAARGACGVGRVIVYCRVCEQDTMPFANGCCPWCDTHTVTGEVNAAMHADTMIARRRTQTREATRRRRERLRQQVTA